MWKVLIPVALCSLISGSRGQIIEADVPVELMECIQLLSNGTGTMDLQFDKNQEIYAHCLQQFLWKEAHVKWSDFNITEKEKGFVNSLVHSFVRRGRSKRYAKPGKLGKMGPGGMGPGGMGPGGMGPGGMGPGGMGPGGMGPGGMGPGSIWPMTGFRIRREYRRISDQERAAFHSAINIMKMNGQYDTFANIHMGIVTTSAHGGPNFLGWHRVYLAMVEEAIRRIRPWVSLPYWDSTLDFDMVDPVDSIIWTEGFLGNGNGFVTTGPFANWITPSGQLTRNIGANSRLLSKEVIRSILTRCRVQEITEPTAMPEFNLELHHGGPHVWVGGQMSGLNTAAHDPVFFLHHAYIDYVMELFRIRQATFCGVNPATDYPPTAGQHAAERPMDGFPQYRNIDGYANYWTQFWYRYERSPTCSWMLPFCGSPYLRCDLTRQRCVSVTRMGRSPMATAAGGAASFAAMAPSSVESVSMARAQESTIFIGPRFAAPPPEPRTQAVRLGRKKRAANQTLPRQSQEYFNNSRTLGPISDSRTANASPAEFQNGAFIGGVIGVHQSYENAASSNQNSYSPQLLPLPDYHETTINDMLKPPIRNSFIINGRADVSQWVFIPVKIIYSSKGGDPATTVPERESRYGPNIQQSSFSSSNTQSDVETGTKCVQDGSGAMQVRVQSIGLNYNGEYSDYALIDTHLPVDSAMIFLGVKSPEKQPSKVVLSAVHSCGLMCQAYCQSPDTAPAFKPCPGVLNITNNDPSVYGRTYDEAILHSQKNMDAGGGLQDKGVKIAFDCSNVDKAWFAKQRA